MNKLETCGTYFLFRFLTVSFYGICALWIQSEMEVN